MDEDGDGKPQGCTVLVVTAGSWTRLTARVTAAESTEI
jgi:hypothetical protein